LTRAQAINRYLDPEDLPVQVQVSAGAFPSCVRIGGPGATDESTTPAIMQVKDQLFGAIVFK